MTDTLTRPGADASIADDLAAYVYQTRFEDIPDAVVAAAKLQLVDTVACLLGGSAAPGCEQIRDAAVAWGGPEEATVLGDGRKALAMFAALANGSMIQALDFDDTHDMGGTHTYAPVLPAVFAAAERRGGVSGREFLTTLILAIDIHGRFAAASRPKLHNGWHPTAICGVFGAAAGAARALGLNADGIREALGLAYSSVAGTRQPILDGVLSKRLQSGLAAEAGVQAALLAAAGITGVRQPVDGMYGFSEMFTAGQMDFPVLTGEIGTRYEVSNISLKPYPCCRSTHSSIDVALDLLRSGEVRPDEIKWVRVWGPRLTVELVGAPFAIRTNPQVDAQFSIPYTVATAFLRGTVEIEDFFEENILNRRDVHDLAARVEVLRDDSLHRPDGQQLAIMEVETKTGAKRITRPNVRGNPKDPLTVEDVRRKLRSCAAIAAHPLSAAEADDVAGLIEQLETVPDLAELARALSR